MTSERNERVDAGMVKSMNTVKARVWSITINNPTTDDLQQWEAMKGLTWVREQKGQMEQGESGTPHLQAMLRTENVRMSQVKRALPRAHIEPARNADALARYVQKDETRTGRIPTTKVATAQDLQRMLHYLTLCDLYHNDNSRLSHEPIKREDYERRLRYACNHCRVVGQKVGMDVSYEDMMIQKAVDLLITQGYYGIEFVLQNPVVRRGFKEHFIPILIREHGRSYHEETSNGEAIDDQTQTTPAYSIDEA